MRRKFSLAIAAMSIFATSVEAQVARKSIVEHFTNTSCGVCVGVNPTIYSAVAANPHVLHISFHPSSPYTSDIFSLQNKTENDGRTNHYGIFGSTPRVVLNGVSVASNTLSSALTPLASAMSNFEISVSQEKHHTDSFYTTVVIKKVAADTTTNATIFAGVVEDTVNQTGNNGQASHYNVFRKSLSATNGQAIALPANVGDSIVTQFNYKAAAAWQIERLNTFVILSRNNKQVIQAAKSVNSNAPVVIPNALANTTITQTLVYPNPSNGIFYTAMAAKKLSIVNTNGVVVRTYYNITENTRLDLSTLAKGNYFINLQNSLGDYKAVIKID
jgi:hypothetical protein